MKLQKTSVWSKIPNWVWLLISLAVAIALWLVASTLWPVVFANPAQIWAAFTARVMDGTLAGHVWASVSRVLIGFGIAFIVAIPVAFLMAWYDPFRHVVEPWIQVMVITIYQGVKGVDTTLIKAARVLGAKQTDIFFKITIPASTPFILVAARLGLSTSLTTLMASEIVGGDKGIGMMIQRASGYYQMDVVLMGIILLGIIGIIFEKIVKYLERRFTGWQETIQQ